MVRRSDDWIRRNLHEATEWEFDQHHLAKDMVVGSMEHKAIFSLYRYPYKTLFFKHLKRVSNYKKQPYYGKNGGLIGNEVLYIAGEGIGIKISLGDRCRFLNALPRMASVCTSWCLTKISFLINGVRDGGITEHTGTNMETVITCPHHSCLIPQLTCVTMLGKNP